MTDATLIAVDREVLVRARPETVFTFFSDSDRLSAWFGPGSTVDPQVGGEVVIKFPDGAAVARGEIVALDPPRSITFTWGYDDNPDLPPGASTVEVVLTEVGEGTRVVLQHRFTAEKLSGAHVAGWRHHLGHLATLSTRDGHADASTIADGWFASWAEADDARRSTALEGVAVPGVRLVDDLVSTAGIEEVAAHIANARLHLAGTTPRRRGPALLVGDRVLADWVLHHDEHGEVGEGRVVLTVDLDSKVTDVVSAWATPMEEVGVRLHGQQPSSPTDVDRDPAIEPHLWTDDLPGAVAWYEAALGFSVEATHPAEGEASWVRLRRGEAAVMIAITPPDRQAAGNQSYLAVVRDRLDHGGPVAFYLGVADIDAAWAAAARAGAEVLEELWDPWWGGRQFTVAGPDGVWWTLFAQPAG